jgi:hypothetical protein
VQAVVIVVVIVGELSPDQWKAGEETRDEPSLPDESSEEDSNEEIEDLFVTLPPLMLCLE